MNNNQIDNFINTKVAELKNKLSGKKVLLAYSGRLDSVVCAQILYKACGDNLICVFVDNGLLRKNEVEKVLQNYKNYFTLPLVTIYGKDRFLNKLQNIIKPESKRKIVGREFINAFKSYKSEQTDKIDYFAQGTIRSDIVESVKSKDGKFIKTHHNVGGLPKNLGFKEIIEPLKDLYKTDIKLIAQKLNLPEELINYQSFSGPGLATRIIGKVTQEKINIVKEADFIFRDEIDKTDLKYKLFQYFAILIDTRSTGVIKGNRVFGNTIVLRAVITSNGIKAKFCKLPYKILQKVSTRITSEILGVNRVVYDITSKPPATIEWE
ncbi:MAG: glutamine-hydrolyzing GMP synthase [Clostridia bacterium]|jgi:GMP synthase (glutamine-hydrolysing)|nr:glutamine-hydrolyzing GMP synthase [Clostridia bacterium]MDD4275898.1 glutamine-hydrolyzing GMP synthase [Clostridia bacterium]